MKAAPSAPADAHLLPNALNIAQSTKMNALVLVLPPKVRLANLGGLGNRHRFHQKEEFLPGEMNHHARFGDSMGSSRG